MINVEMKFCLTYAETELLKENMAKANRGQVDIAAHDVRHTCQLISSA